MIQVTIAMTEATTVEGSTTASPKKIAAAIVKHKAPNMQIGNAMDKAKIKVPEMKNVYIKTGGPANVANVANKLERIGRCAINAGMVNWKPWKSGSGSN